MQRIMSLPPINSWNPLPSFMTMQVNDDNFPNSKDGTLAEDCSNSPNIEANANDVLEKEIAKNGTTTEQNNATAKICQAAKQNNAANSKEA